jgi:DNA-directed RNA polymerase subunit omega
MPTVPLEDLLEIIPNKFNLVTVASKRARQIKDGAPRLVDTDSVNPVTIALEEISAGAIYLDGTVARVKEEFAAALGFTNNNRQASDLLALPEEDDLLDLDDTPGLSADTSDGLALPEPDDSIE